MNRAFSATTAFLLAMLGALPSHGATPLVVGSVRDQRGAPIEGARVTAQRAGGEIASTATDRFGTFVLRAADVSAVTIACRYCQSATFAVRPGEAVVAIVRHYDALAGVAPSSDDLDNLPYAHVESAAALRPFALLAQSSGNYPGSRLSDRGLAATGSLTIDNAVPDYDVVTGQSPYWTIPSNYERSAQLGDAADAFLYGDEAGGGTTVLDPFLQGSNAQVATLGGDTIARAQVGSDAAALAAGTYSNDQESRQRADGFATLPLAGGASLTLLGGSEQGREYAVADDTLASNYSFGRVAFEDPGPLDVSVSALADRGTYAQTYGDYGAASVWSDTGFTAGVRSRGSVAAFADVSQRSSTGSYDPLDLAYQSSIGATLSQTRVDAGVDASGADYHVTAGVGAFWINYGGGAGGVSWPAHASLAVPSVQAQLFPQGKWSLSLQGSGSFDLPTFAQQYGYALYPSATVELTRSTLLGGSLDYTDVSRVRLSFEAATAGTTGASSGTVTSEGLSAAWQIAPAISLRAWTMHVTDTAPVYGVGLPYDGNAPTVNAMWLTYENPGALRIDAIYRRDLLDALPFYHVDGDVSGPIFGGLRWYAGAEDRQRRTFVDAGLRLNSR